MAEALVERYLTRPDPYLYGIPESPNPTSYHQVIERRSRIGTLEEADFTMACLVSPDAAALATFQPDLTTLSFILFAARDRTQRNNNLPKRKRGAFRPTLLVTPTVVIDVWIKEIDRYFGDQMEVLIFYGSTQSTGNYRYKRRTIDKLKHLHERINKLDPTDVKTAPTVVITSYSTWSLRTTQEVQPEDQEDQEIQPVSEHISRFRLWVVAMN